MTKTYWECSECGFVSVVDAYELPEVGTPFCPECADEIEMERADEVYAKEEELDDV